MPCCTKIPETADKDVDDVGQYLEGLSKAFKSLEKNIAETITEYQQLMTSYEKVAHTFTEITQENDRNIQLFSKDFEAEMRKLKDGPAMASLQMDISRYVKEGLKPIIAEREKVAKMYKVLRDLRKSYDTYRYDISETEKKYAKKNKSLTESKSYAQKGKKRDEVSAKYETRKKEIVTAVAHLKELIYDFVSHALPGYAVSSGSFAKHLGLQLESYAAGIGPKANVGTTSETSHNNGSLVEENGKSMDGKQSDLLQKNTSSNPLTLEQEYYQQIAK
ncbi:uncharacterized protein TM35_001251030 [Trypanosoma theileri]|uniref:Uncharacterized protein n=1 Tax=Trypanosoma theileri TaxID=67003 RepID=A0A1X0NFG5_9TRYP|nr:uncharacterized protein TM35_001251030 [Trypanosoma theileri]ORC81208.1 hypothetical protein TM35_001251030 [Trypanosoma theileri]